MSITIVDYHYNQYELFNKYYEELAYKELNYKELEYLGNSKNKKCRFCGESEPEVSFNKIAHVFPEAIGNKTLVSYYECNNCNKFFGDKLEGEYANCFSLYHTIYKVHGKKGIPTHEQNKGNTKIKIIKNPETGKEICLVIESTDKVLGETSFKIDKNNKTFKIDTKSNKYIPIAVFKCFVKMALSVMPEEEIKYYSDAIKWIKEKKHKNFYMNNKNLMCRWVQLNMKAVRNNPQYSLYKLRKEFVTYEYPYMLFQLTYGGFSYLIEVPQDINLSKKGVEEIDFPLKQEDILNIGAYNFTSDKKTTMEKSLEYVFEDFTEDENSTIKSLPELYNKLKWKSEGDI